MIAALIEFVAAARAERRNRAFIVAMREAERVDLERRVMEFRLGEIGHEHGLSHGHDLRRRSRALGGDLAADEARGDRRSVEMQDRR